MKAFQIDNFAALIGIDWADQKHDMCEFSMKDGDYQYQVVSSKPHALHDWAMALKAKYPSQQIAVGCEQKKGPLIYTLLKYDHLTLFLINPSSVANYRKTFTHSGAKDDPTDALIQADLLRLHMEKLTPILPEDPEVRALAQLVEYRRTLVQDRVKLSNRITTLLKNYYPHALEWFKDRDTLIFCHFIMRWPSLQSAKSARKATLISFMKKHNSRYKNVNEERIHSIKNAFALTDDEGIIFPNQLMIEMLVPQLEQAISSIEKIDKEVKALFKKQKDKALFESFPGAGPQLAPRLLAAFGNNRSRFKTASEIQKYVGVAPIIERSGKKEWIHWRYSCPKFLRQTFVEWAGQSVRFSYWAKAYYHQQMSKGKSHNTVIRSLAFKWIRIAFKCWQDRKPYDESKYLEALKLRGSPLLKYAADM